MTPQPLDIGFLILSCDKYADLWPPFFEAFFDQWPDCPFPVYLASNTVAHHDPRVTSLLSGPDADWSTSILAALNQVKHKYVLMHIEDAFIHLPVANTRILSLLQWASDRDAKCLRLRPEADEPTDHPDIGRIREHSLYRTALHSAMFDREFLMGILKPGESAWHFEVNSPRRTRKEPKIYATYLTEIPVLHGVEKGAWYVDVLKVMQERGYVRGPVTRPVLARGQTEVSRKRTRVKNFIKMLLPGRLRGWAHRVLWNHFR